MAKLTLRPDEASYAQTPGSEVASVQLNGGRAWRRKTKDNASSIVNVTWILEEGEYQLFWAFFRVYTARGSLPFNMDLVLEDSILEDVECYFNTEPSLAAKDNGVYTVTSELEVIRPAYDPDLDLAFVDGYTAYGDGLAAIFDRLAIFANEDMPDTLGSIVIPDFGFLNNPVPVVFAVASNPFQIIPPVLLNTSVGVVFEVSANALEVNTLVNINTPVEVVFDINDAPFNIIEPVQINAPVEVIFSVENQLNISGVVQIDTPIEVVFGIEESPFVVSPTVKIDTPVEVIFSVGNDILVEEAFDADAQAFFDACDTEPSAAAKTAINDLVTGLKADAIWDELDAFWPMCMEDSQAGRLNLKSPGDFTLTAVNSPTFTAKYGWAGNGTSSYLNTGWDPATNGSNYTQNDASFGCWVDAGTDSGSNVAVIMGGFATRGSILYPRLSAGTVAYYINSSVSSASTSTVTTRQGLTVAERIGASSVQVFRDGASLGTDTETSGALAAADVYIGAGNNNGTAFGYSDNRISCAFVAGSLGSTKQGDLYDRLDTFRTAMAAL